MTLVDRVSAFFLAALAVSLVAFAAAIFFSIRFYLYDEFDAQIYVGMRVVAAAVEIEADSVKWQPTEHTVDVGDDLDRDEVRWILVDGRGSTIDQSENLRNDPSEATRLARLPRADDRSALQFSEHERWRYLQQDLAARDPKPEIELDPDEFARVTLTVAKPTYEVHAKVWRLGIFCLALPVLLWTLAALAGRWYCRRALHPVQQISSQAKDARFNGFHMRLPVSSQRDELSEMAEAFNGLLDRLQDVFERQQRFAGDAAHQLKTPLTILRGQIDVALRQPRSEAEYRDTLETISEQTTQLQNIIQSLLLLARQDHAAQPTDRQRLPLANWLREYAQNWDEIPRSGDLTWDIQTARAIESSPTLLRQLLDNLIDNALKYTSAGTRICVCAVDRLDSVELSVTDEGPGISDEDQVQIFEPFYRSASARRRGISGTGLGLAMVARIAENLGGQIGCESIPDVETRFTLRLPFDSPPREGR